jgi:hypothetical protein
VITDLSEIEQVPSKESKHCNQFRTGSLLRWLLQGEESCEDWGLICGELRLREREITPAGGCCPQPGKMKVVPSISCLIRLVHLLSGLLSKQHLSLTNPNTNGLRQSRPNRSLTYFNTTPLAALFPSQQPP